VHVIRNNLSVGNKAAGFYANHHPGTITFYNNTSYNNDPDFKMLGMNTAGADITVGTYRNNLAVGGSLTANATNPDDANNSWTLSVTANAADFQSTSETGLDGPRQADGSLPNLANFHLVADSDLIDKGIDVGLPFNGKAPDLGCFETGGSTGGTASTGGAAGTGGAVNAGGTVAVTGGATGNGGTKATGGSKASIGGATSGAGGTVAVIGGATGNGGTQSQVGVTTSAGVANAGGSINATGGAVATTAGAATVGGGLATGGLANLGGAESSGGAAAGNGDASTAGNDTSTTPAGSGNPGASQDSGGCGCRIPSGHSSHFGFATSLSLVGLACVRLLRRRRAKRERS
jgi:hypothetical protein